MDAFWAAQIYKGIGNFFLSFDAQYPLGGSNEFMFVDLFTAVIQVKTRDLDVYAYSPLELIKGVIVA